MKIITSSDNTKKLIFNGYEAVILYLTNKVTLCISSQIGCKLNCDFCRTGKLGFKRNLTKDEIIEQYLEASKLETINAIVFMGMGEPLDNYENVRYAILELNQKYSFSQKKITVSTAGIPDKIIQLSKDTSARLAISLNATDNETRSKLMPINKTYPIEEIINSLKQIKNDRHNPVMIEYVLLKNINDKNVDKIAELFQNIEILMSLIPYNCHDKAEYKSTDKAKIEEIKQVLMKKGIKTFIRESKGSDILAACGTLG